MKTSTVHELATAIVHLDPRFRGGLRFKVVHRKLGHESAQRVREGEIVRMYLSWSVIEGIVKERTDAKKGEESYLVHLRGYCLPIVIVNIVCNGSDEASVTGADGVRKYS